MQTEIFPHRPKPAGRFAAPRSPALDSDEAARGEHFEHVPQRGAFNIYVDGFIRLRREYHYPPARDAREFIRNLPVSPAAPQFERHKLLERGGHARAGLAVDA